MEEVAEEETKQEIINALEGMTSAISSGNSDLASAFSAGSNSVAGAITDGSEAVSSSITTGNNQLASAYSAGSNTLKEAFEEGSEAMSASITSGHNTVASALNSANDALVEAVEEGNSDVASAITSGNSDVADAITLGNSGVADAITSGNSGVADAITSGNSGISSAITLGNEKIANSNDEVAKIITAGSTKVAESIDDTKSALDTLKADLTNSISVGNGLIATSITTGDGKIEAALNGNRDAITSIKDTLDTQNTKLENALDGVAENIEVAGQDNRQMLSDISTNILKNADNLLQLGTDTNTGLMSLAGNMEKAALSIETLTAQSGTASADSKAALETIAAKLDEASGHLQTSASQTGVLASALNTFATDAKNSIDNLKTAVQTSGSSNDISLQAVKDAIIDFKNTADSDTMEVVAAMHLYKNTLGEGFTELKEELDEIEQAIVNSNQRSLQLASITRLADKIECTTDCFLSSEQADAIVSGLDRNDQNVAALIDDINSAAANLPPETEDVIVDRRFGAEARSSEYQENPYDDIDNSFATDLLDTSIALQSSDNEISNKFSSKGYNVQKFNNLLENIVNNPESLRTVSTEFDALMEAANITIPKNINLKNYLKRKGRSILSASKSSTAIKDLKRILSQNGKGKTGFGSLNINILQSLTEEYKFTNKSNFDIIKKLSRNVRDNTDLKPADGPAKSTWQEVVADPLVGLGVYGAASQVSAQAFKEIYDGDNELWQTYRPDGLLDPTNPLWVKNLDSDEYDRYEYMNMSGSMI